jgi:hypothetical protein
MRTIRAFPVLAIALLLVVSVGVWSPSGQAQTALEEWAKQQISDKTGIDPNLLATLFVTDGSDQFILAFVYITEETLQSNLKPEIKQAIAPFVGARAMLTLVVATRASSFNPLEISFAQDGLTYLIGSSQISPITEDFRAGQLPSNEVSAGVLLLPEGIDVQRPFEIHYRGSFSTTFSIGGSGASQPPGFVFPGLLFSLLYVILFFFLLPFLVVL